MVDSGHLLSSRSTRPIIAIGSTSSHHPKDRTLSLVRPFPIAIAHRNNKMEGVVVLTAGKFRETLENKCVQSWGTRKRRCKKYCGVKHPVKRDHPPKLRRRTLHTEYTTSTVAAH